MTSGSHGGAGAIYRIHGSPTIKVEIVGDDGKPTGVGDGIAGHFRVSYPDGRVELFGTTAKTKTNSRWLITSLNDRHQNWMRFEYTILAGFKEILPSAIVYTLSDRTSAEYPSADTGSRRVTFEYEARPEQDRYQAWRPMGLGQAARLHRLTSVNTYAEDDLVHTYRVHYDPPGISNRTLVNGIQKCDAAAACLPMTEFDWELGTKGYEVHALDPAVAAVVPNFDEIVASLAADVDHDGKTEFLFAPQSQADSTAAYWKAWDPDSGFHPTAAAAFLVEGSSALPPSIADFNGDGVSDIVSPFCQEGHCKDDAFDPILYPYANAVAVTLGAEGSHFSNAKTQFVYSTANHQRIFMAHVAEIDGDGFPDMFACTGDNANNALWTLLLNRPVNSKDYQVRELVSYPTRRSCYAPELYQVMDADADGRDELWVTLKKRPGRSIHQGTMFVLNPDYNFDDPSVDFNEPGPGKSGVVRYVGLELPRFDENGGALTIGDALSSLSSLTAYEAYTGWPVEGRVTHSLRLDFGQRLLETCWRPDSEEKLPSAIASKLEELHGTAVADEFIQLYAHPGRPFDDTGSVPAWLESAASGEFPAPNEPSPIPRSLPFVKAGPSSDRHVDINGDGLVDILRVAAFDDLGEVTVPYSQQHEAFPAYCKVDQKFGFGFEFYLNNGVDFSKGGAVQLIEDEFPWRAAQMLARVSVVDYNSDGRADLLAPHFAEFAEFGVVDQWAVWTATLTDTDVFPDSGPSAIAFAPQDLGFDPIALAVYQPWYDGSYEWSQMLQTRIVELEQQLGVPHVEMPFKKFPHLVSTATSAVHLTDKRMQDIIFFPGTDTEIEPKALRKAGDRPDYLKRVVDGLGAKTEWDYVSGYNPESYGLGDGSETTAPFTPSVVVSERRRDLGLGYGKWMHYRHGYSNARSDRRGLGSLGFAVSTVSMQTNSEDDTEVVKVTERGRSFEYDGARFQYPLSGHTTRTFSETRFQNGVGSETRKVDEQRIEWQTFDAVHSNFSSFAETRSTASFELGSANCGGVPCYRYTNLDAHEPLKSNRTQIVEIDELGNPRRTVTESGDGAIVETSSTYLNQVGNYDFPYGGGLLQSRQTTNTVAGNSETRSMSVDYDPFTLLVESQTQEPSEEGTPLWRKITPVPDTRGNVELVSLSSNSEVRTTHTSFDEHGYFAIHEVNPVGHVVESHWHPGLSIPLRLIDPNGVVTETSVDGFGRPTRTRVRSSLGGPLNGEDLTYHIETSPGAFDIGAAFRVVTKRNGFDQLILDSDRLGREKRRIWRVFTGEVQLGDEWMKLTQYDELGNTARVSVPVEYGTTAASAPWTTFEYDRRGRLVRKNNPDGFYEIWSRDKLRVAHWEQTTLKDATTTNQRGQLVHRKIGSLATCYEYGAFETLRIVRRNCDEEDGQPQRITSQHFDRLGRRTALQDPELGNRIETWDGFDQRVLLIDGNNDAIDFGYDGLGRVTHRTSTDGIARWTYDIHDNGVGKLAFSENEEVSAGTAGIKRSHDYDDFGRPAETVTSVDGIDYRVRTEYAANRVSRVRYPGIPFLNSELPYSVRYNYDFYGHTTSIVEELEENMGSLLWELQAMDGWGHIVSERASLNDFVTTRAFDPLTGRQTLSQAAMEGADPIVSREYDWNPNGNLREVLDQVSGESRGYTYDVLDQLETVTNSKTSEASSIRYDIYGNIELKSDVGAYSYNEQTGRLELAGGEPFSYDANGSLLSRGKEGAATTFTWTSIGKLEGVSGEMGAANLRYDADGNEVRKTVAAGVDTISVGALAQIVNPSGGSTEYRYSVLLGGRPVAHVTRPFFGPMTRRYIHTDYRGSNLAVSTGDGSVEESDYDAWGLEIAGSSDPFTEESTSVGFTGHDAELVAGMIDMKARYYDPKLGRFHAADTIVPDPVNALDWNRYAYVRNNPLRYTDPTGHEPSGDSGEGGGGDDVSTDEGDEGGDDDSACQPGDENPGCPDSTQPMPTPPPEGTTGVPGLGQDRRSHGKTWSDCAGDWDCQIRVLETERLQCKGYACAGADMIHQPLAKGCEDRESERPGRTRSRRGDGRLARKRIARRDGACIRCRRRCNDLSQNRSRPWCSKCIAHRRVFGNAEGPKCRQPHLWTKITGEA